MAFPLLSLPAISLQGLCAIGLSQLSLNPRDFWCSKCASVNCSGFQMCYSCTIWARSQEICSNLMGKRDAKGSILQISKFVLKRFFKGKFSQPLPGFPVCDTSSVHSLLLLSHLCPQKQRFGLKAPDLGLQPQNPTKGLISDSSPLSVCISHVPALLVRNRGVTAAPWTPGLQLWR